MIIMIDIAEMRSYLINNCFEAGLMREIFNVKLDTDSEQRAYLEWLFKKYFSQIGFRVISFVCYDDFDHNFKNNYAIIMGFIDHHMYLRAEVIFNLNRIKNTVSLMISYNTLIISIEDV